MSFENVVFADECCVVIGWPRRKRGLKKGEGKVWETTTLHKKSMFRGAMGINGPIGL